MSRPRPLNTTSRPRPLNTTSRALFDHLVQGITELGECRKVDNAADTYMAVHVARLGERVYSISHQYVQNGDVMMDPEVHFYVANSGEVFPCMFRQDGTGYRIDALWEKDGEIVFKPHAQRDVASFVGDWFTNIRRQQGIRVPRSAACCRTVG